MNDENIINKALDKALDEVYSQYENDHNLRSTVYIHPMFYNGTFSEDNSYQPEEPESLLTKEDFFTKIKKDDIDSIWSHGFQVLFNYFLKQYYD